MASKTSFYNNSGVTNEQSNAIDASVSNAEASATSASNSATAAANSASSASTSAATATTSKDAAVVAKDAAVVAKNAAEAAAGGISGALAKSNNLSDLTNASTARTNLGVAIGSDVQAYSSILQSTTAAYTSALNTKLSGIEASATADQTKSDIDALGINATSVSGYTVGKSVPSNAVFTDTNTTYSVGDGGLTQNNFTNADHTKLDGIEASADVTDTANVVAALTAGTNITIAANGTIASTASGGTSYTHPNHSGEVTSSGDGATVIASNVVDADNLKVTGNGSNTQFLRSDGDGTFTWATPVDTNTTYTVGDGALTQKNFTTALNAKLDGIEASATADQTKSDIDALGINATSVSGFTVGKSVPSNAVFTDTTYSIGDGGLTTNDFTNADHTKLNAIEASATADQTDAEIRAAVEAAADSNVFTDADHSKLNAIEANATADQTASEIRTLVESATDSNVFTDADHTKLNAIEASADVTDTTNVVAALTAGTNVSIAANGTISSTDTNTTYSVGDGGLTTNDFTNADHSKLDGIATSANNYTHPNHSGEVTSTADGATVIADNVVDEANLKVSNTPTNGYVLTAQSGNTGGLTWAAAASGGGADLFAENYDGTSTLPSATGTNAVAIGDGSNSTGYKSFAAAIGNTYVSYGANGFASVAIGLQSRANGTSSVAIGQSAKSEGTSSFAFGGYANYNYSTSLGWFARAEAVGASAVGKSTASGTSSFAANIDNNTSSYGATGANSVAIGANAKASVTNSIAIGKDTLVDTYDGIALGRNARAGNNAISIGQTGWGSGQSYAQGQASISIGQNNLAQQTASVVLGMHGHSNTVGKYVYSSGYLGGQGNAQTGTFILIASTTDATATSMATNSSTASATNQITLPNNSAYTFSGTVVAREKASEGTDVGSWEVKGIIRREANAGTTVLVNSVTNELNSPTGWAIALTADTTNGCLKVEATGVTSTNIRWVATINTSEVIYA